MIGPATTLAALGRECAQLGIRHLNCSTPAPAMYVVVAIGQYTETGTGDTLADAAAAAVARYRQAMARRLGDGVAVGAEGGV